MSTRLSRGWQNPWRETDPTMRRTLESVSSWASKLGAGCYVVRNVAQLIPNNVYTTVEWDTVWRDPFNFWDAANPGVLTVPDGFSGIYVLDTAVTFDVSASGYRGITDVTPEIDDARKVVALSGVTTPVWLSKNQMAFREGDTVDIRAYQNSGGDLNVVGTNDNFVALTRVGDYRG